MHYENTLFWERCKWKYSKYFKDPSRVIEFGSRYINGTVKAHFWCKDYIGVDAGGDFFVDVVSLAHEVKFERESFDVVVSASMLEHDVHWEKSIQKMVTLLKQDGLLAITWGAALNGEHGNKLSLDGGFHPQKAGQIINKLEELGMYIHEFQYERSLLPPTVKRFRPMPIGMGEVVLVAFKDKKHAIGESLIDELIKEDKI